MGELVAALLWAAIEIAFVLLAFTGKVVVAVASFGRWRSEKLSGIEGHIYGAAGALSFKRDGQRVVTPTGLLFVGGLFYALLGFAALWLVSLP